MTLTPRLLPIVLISSGLLAACGDDGATPSGSSTSSGPTSSSSGTGGGGGVGGGGAGGGGAGGAGDVDPIAGIGPAEEITVDQAFQFLEGPLWLAGEGALLFSDIPANRIYKYTPPQTIEVFRDPSGGSNGLLLDGEGRLIACEHGNRRVSRTRQDGTIEAIADSWEGRRLNSPNDAIVRSDGSIYFTDPPYGIAPEQQELAFQGVFRVDPAGAITLVMDDMNRPNGIALSPDETKLYVSDSGEPQVRVLPVNADGSTGEWTKLIDRPSDGMAVDTQGNIYLTNDSGVEVFRADGTKRGDIAVGGRTTNVGFGGPDNKTLYITTANALYRVGVNVAGL